MDNRKTHTIYTIGHSTHEMATFLNMLHSFSIELLVDIRSFPSSKKYPQYNKKSMETEIEQGGIKYLHIAEIGGRRPVKKNSHNNRWKNASFRGYADYMETDLFTKAIAILEVLAINQRTAFMCSEAVWWRCHRSMVSDYLKAKGWEVIHIMGINKATYHSYTSPARVVGDAVLYYDDDLFSIK